MARKADCGCHKISGQFLPRLTLSGTYCRELQSLKIRQNAVLPGFSPWHGVCWSLAVNG